MKPPVSTGRLLLGALPALLWVALILGASTFSHPSDVIPSGIRIWDKALHAGAYGVFGLLAAGGLQFAFRWRLPPLLLVAMVTVLAFAVGCLDEFIQWHRASRTAEWGDVAADAFGGFLGSSAWAVVTMLRKDRGPSTADQHQEDPD